MGSSYFEFDEQPRPMVSVGMLTYNHEKYIASALDSILMQNVNFKYEIVVCDDCSSDNTKDILLRYMQKYPKVIKVYLNEKNLGAQGNANKLRTLCTGKYRATLEGDDYWITTSKLQTQVDFLESHPDFVAIGGDFTCINDKGKPCLFPWGDIKYTYCQDEEYTMEHLENWLLPAHASCMCFRNIFFDFNEEALNYFHSLSILGDRRTSMYLLMHGRIFHQKEVLMIRRVLDTSSSSMTALTKHTNWHARNYLWMIETERCVRERFHREINLSPYKELRWLGSLRVFAQSPTISNYKLMRFIYAHSDAKKRYRHLAYEELKKVYSNSVNKCGRLKTVKKGIAICLKAAKKLLFRTKTVKSKELKLYELSMGGSKFA